MGPGTPAATLPLRPQSAEPRRLGLDWLRAAATLLVVLLHAGIPYQRHPLPGLVWATESPQLSGMIDLVCWWINGFIMPLFFLMSGYFAAGLCARLGPQRFLWHRMSRIGGPLALGIVLILPLDLYVWLLGWVNAGWITPRQMQTLKVGSPLGDSLWGLSHLWFLEYLLLYCLCGWAICSLLEHRRRPRSAERASRPREPERSRGGAAPSDVGRIAALFVAAVAFSAALLWCQPRIVIGFRHGWLPMWENALYFAVPFVLGWAWCRRRERLVPAWQGGIGLAAATLVYLLVLPRLWHHLGHESIPASDPLLAIFFATFGLMMAASLFAIALGRNWPAPPRPIRYVCEASFWIYLAHHPLVALTHIDLALVGWSPAFNFTLAFLVPLLLALASYEVLVRRTLLGTLLNGRRAARPPLAGQLDFSRQHVAQAMRYDCGLNTVRS